MKKGSRGKLKRKTKQIGSVFLDAGKHYDLRFTIHTSQKDMAIYEGVSLVTINTRKNAGKLITIQDDTRKVVGYISVDRLNRMLLEHNYLRWDE